jgi:murein L,D-transpeptidase YcbB/YkuD
MTPSLAIALTVAALVGTIVIGVRAPIGARRGRRYAAGIVCVALVAASCSDDDGGDEVETTGVETGEDTTPEATEAVATTEAPATTEPEDPIAAAEARVADAEDGVESAQSAYDEAGDQFCADTEGYVEALDRYGKLFSDEAATVGDVRTGGEDLIEPRDTVMASADSLIAAREELAAAQQELLDAQAALAEAIATASSIPTSSSAPATTTTTTLVPAATIERVEAAEKDLERTARGINDDTPLAQATAEYNSAALALQIAWMRLLFDAGCLSDEQQAEAVAQVTAFTTNLQTTLTQLDYYDGPIDGVYGPATVDAVKRLQADSGLRETGFVDQATSRAIDALLEQQGLAEMTFTATVQTVLTLTSFWTGPIDGQWTDELTNALMQFQTALGVPPTGVVDPATMAAFEDAVAAVRTLVSATTVPATPAPEPTEPPEPDETVPETVPETSPESAPSTSTA